MTNKQDEGMTISKAKEIIAVCEADNLQHSVKYWQAVGFIEGWDARGKETEEISTEFLERAHEDAVNFLKLQSEGEK